MPRRTHMCPQSLHYLLQDCCHPYHLIRPLYNRVSLNTIYSKFKLLSMFTFCLLCSLLKYKIHKVSEILLRQLPHLFIFLRWCTHFFQPYFHNWISNVIFYGEISVPSRIKIREQDILFMWWFKLICCSWPLTLAPRIYPEHKPLEHNDGLCLMSVMMMKEYQIMWFAQWVMFDQEINVYLYEVIKIMSMINY